MYKVSPDTEYYLQIDYGDFGDRIRELLACDGKKKIIYIATEFNNSTFRYRFLNFKETLKNKSKYVPICFESNEIPNILKYTEKFSAVVMQRTSIDNNVNNLIFICKRNKIPVAYDVDDLIYNPNLILDYVNNLGDKSTDSETLKVLLGLSVGHWLVAKQCDSFICTNSYLKKHLSNDFGKKVYVIANYYNIEQERCSQTVLSKREFDSEKFYIGYFSGSTSHQNDFGVCEQALIQLLNKYEDIYLKIVGFMNLSEELKKFSKKKRIVFKPLCPYEELQYEIGGVDVNIAPLVDYSFNACKSELKFFEAALVKVPSVVSNVGVYNDIIKDGENGFLCDQTMWFNVLEKMYLDSDLRRKITENAYKYTVENYHYSKFLSDIEKVFDAIIASN